MNLPNLARRFLGDSLRQTPTVYEFLKNSENRFERCRHGLARFVAPIIRPRPYKIMIAVTAACNARCQGCKYGRDFMVGSKLSLDMVLGVLDDAARAGFYSIRFYGGEPLLHPDLPAMVRRCVELGMRPYVTTNAILLDQKIDELVEAGLRDLTVGFYGTGTAYDEYTETPGAYEQVVRGIGAVHARHRGTVEMQLNWLLMRPTASVEALGLACDLARRFDMSMRVDLVHYSLPYFDEGEDNCLQFRAEDRPAIEAVTRELIRIKQEQPDLLHHTIEGLRSIPDWLMLGPEMRIPCTAYEMVWVGANGDVQMCYVTFPLGSLRDKRLSEMLMTEEHRSAARDAFKLNCPNCHCSSNERVMRHGPSLRRYSKD